VQHEGQFTALIAKPLRITERPFAGAALPNTKMNPDPPHGAGRGISNRGRPARVLGVLVVPPPGPDAEAWACMCCHRWQRRPVMKNTVISSTLLN
jgi:hypothetical protein